MRRPPRYNLFPYKTLFRSFSKKVLYIYGFLDLSGNLQSIGTLYTRHIFLSLRIFEKKVRKRDIFFRIENYYTVVRASLDFICSEAKLSKHGPLSNAGSTTVISHTD